MAERPRAPVRDRHGYLAVLDGMQAGLIARVRDVHKHADLVHAADGPPSQRGQATVKLFGQPEPSWLLLL